MAEKQTKSIISEILKFVVFLFLIPLIIALTVSFCQEFRSLPIGYKLAFNWGVVVYLAVHLLLFELNGIYLFGQKLVVFIFGFLGPLVKVAPYFFPIYSILLMIAFYFENQFFNSWKIDLILIFFISFTLMMHLVLTAKALKGSDSGVVQPNYLFAMSSIFVINILLVSLLLHLIIPEFTFMTFFKHTAVITKGIYLEAYRQLF